MGTQAPSIWDQAEQLNQKPASGDVWDQAEKLNTGTPKESAASRFNASLSTGLGAEPGLVDTLKSLGGGLKHLVTHPIDSGSLLLHGAADAQQGVIDKAYQEQQSPDLATRAKGYVRGAESAIPILGPMLSKAGDEFSGGNIAGGLGTTAALAAPVVMGPAIEGAARIPEGIRGIRNAAMEDPNVAAQRALRPSAKKAIQTQSNLQTARPYLQGAESLEDLQSKIPAAKAEIWKPYSDAIEKVGGKQVQGPDGPTTVAELEKERLKTSADLQSVRKMNPSDRQAVLQKQSSVKELMDRDKAIKAALDPELQSAGVDPKLIREVHGSVQGINKLVEGRNTLTENRRYGLGRMAQDVQITKPGSYIPAIGTGIRDVVAGRPLWSGSPTDVAVREGFRIGGEKPNLTPGPVAAPSGLPQGNPTPFGNSAPAVEGPPIAYRAHDVGNPQIKLGSHAHATVNPEEAQSYLEGRGEAEGGKPQKVSKINMGRFTPDEYEVHHGPNGHNWIEFKRQLTDEDYE